MKKYRLTKKRKEFIKETVKDVLIVIIGIIIFSLPDSIAGILY